ncbi:MAG: hypothetical protein WDN69_14965 [Aliidongia sp.]
MAGWWTYRASVEAAEQDARNAVDILDEYARHSLDDDVTLLHILRDEFEPARQRRYGPLLRRSASEDPGYS